MAVRARVSPTKTNVTARSATAYPPAAAPKGSESATLWTTAERLQRIEAMGQRVNGYVQFMCKIGNENCTSVEARDRAVAFFYDQMVILERHLGRIFEEFQLE